MGELAFVAKVTHVRATFISELPGPLPGIRDPTSACPEEVGRRVRALLAR